MPIPALVPFVYENGDVSNQVCTAQGAPINGLNVIPLPWVDQGVNPVLIELGRITFRVEALGPSVTGSSEVSISGDKATATLAFVQGGADEALVEATLHHTTIS
jgi:hypothetical protein